MTESLLKEESIPMHCHGLRIDVVLAQLFPQYSRALLSRWLKKGNILINDLVLKPKDKVLGGERVVLRMAVIDETHEGLVHVAEPIALDVVFEDDSILIINKPAGLVVHPGAGNPRHTLMNALLNHDATLQSLPRAGIVHRLDKDTTGLLIVAKTMESYTALVRQMQAREIKRCYQALVYGHVISGSKLHTYYGRHPRNRLKMAVCQQGREAITEYTVDARFHYFTLLSVQLMTGRTHQIRVHMAHINHPIVGDALYGRGIRMPAGASEEMQSQLQNFKRQALHACSLSLNHPTSGDLLTFDAPLPDDFKSLLVSMEHCFD